MLDYQVREKLEPQELGLDGWRPASPVRGQPRDMHPYRSVSDKQSQARALLSALLGGGETLDDPIIIDDVEEV